MKRFLLCTFVIGIFAVQADAGMWELDRITALEFTTSSVTTGTQSSPLSVYDGPTTKVFGPTLPLEYGPMSGQVGFYGGLTGDVGFPDYGGTAVMEISYTGTLALSDTVGYDGITSYFQNDDNSYWSFQLFYEDSVDSGPHESDWVELAPYGGSTTLAALASGEGLLYLDNITNIGIRVKGEHMGDTDYPGYPSHSDDFHVSIVPVPAAVILGILGMGVAGLKLRKFA